MLQRGGRGAVLHWVHLHMLWELYVLSKRPFIKRQNKLSEPCFQFMPPQVSHTVSMFPKHGLIFVIFHVVWFSCASWTRRPSCDQYTFYTWSLEGKWLNAETHMIRDDATLHEVALPSTNTPNQHCSVFCIHNVFESQRLYRYTHETFSQQMWTHICRRASCFIDWLISPGGFDSQRIA